MQLRPRSTWYRYSAAAAAPADGAIKRKPVAAALWLARIHSRFIPPAMADFQGFIVADSVVLRPAALFVLAAALDSALGELGVVPIKSGLLDIETVEAGGSSP